MTRLGKLLLSLSFLCTFGVGFLSSYLMYPPHVKPPLPTPGPMGVVGSYIEDVGTVACFDEESFANLMNLLIAMGDEFMEPE